MKVMVVGSGGREHALCVALRAAAQGVGGLWCCPGNPGIASVATCVDIPADAIDRLVEFSLRSGVDLVLVGPEVPLVKGLVDALGSKGVRAFGPSADAARLEGSKGFMKELCAREGIPTAGFQRFTDLDVALGHVRQRGCPLVVKADGLAAGKGVTVALTLPDAERAVTEALQGGRFGEAGRSLVIEDYLEGVELSLFALCSGDHAVALGTAMDYKRLRDGDQGPNTGGMGALSPHPLETPALVQQLMDQLVSPTLRGMQREGAPFHGVLYAGVMLTREGPRLIEYNVRFGDPECQALFARWRGELPSLLDALLQGSRDLSRYISWDPRPSVCVVMAAEGYPERPHTGDVIEGLDGHPDTPNTPWCRVFHAGTRRDDQGRVVTSGGRVLNVVALGDTYADAADRAYNTVAQMGWRGEQHRHDVGVWRPAPTP